MTVVNVEVRRNPEEAVHHHMSRWVAKACPTVVRLDVIADPEGPRLSVQTLKLVHQEIYECLAEPNVGRCRLGYEVEDDDEPNDECAICAHLRDGGPKDKLVFMRLQLRYQAQ